MKLSEVFERGIVYADRWPTDVRTQLNVPDPLSDVVAKALQAWKTVIITGNAGDGKSHLAQVALAMAPSRSCLEVTPTSVEASDRETIVFVRDASALEDEVILTAVTYARERGNPLLVTINEGPLASLANQDESGFFADVRRNLHLRETTGETASADDEVLLINLAGRQLVRTGNFVREVLDRVLGAVTACHVCKGLKRQCPRQIGAQLLKKSRVGKERVTELLSLVTGTGDHMTAREIWNFCIDLFFGHVCTADASTATVRGYFWNRIFEDETTIAQVLRHEFDPTSVPLPAVDVRLWLGQWEGQLIGCDYPGEKPVHLYRDDADLGMAAFASVKRAYFFFNKDPSILEILMKRSDAAEYLGLLEKAMKDPPGAVRTLIRLINSSRMEANLEGDLYVSRHHGMSANRRATAFIATDRLKSDALEVLTPFHADMQQFGDAGFFPDRLFLRWIGRATTLEIDFHTWGQLKRKRHLAVDRSQERLDFALDLFMSQAPVTPTDDPEIHVVDHKDGRKFQVRARHDGRALEVL